MRKRSGLKNLQMRAVVVSCVCVATSLCVAQNAGALASQGEYASGPNMDRDLLPTPMKRDDEKRADAAAPVATEAEEESRLHFSAGIDFTNAYYYRGIRQEDRGFLAQPWATLGIDIYKPEGFTLTPYIGTWNSFHDRATGAAQNDNLDDKWYESDIYFGANAAFGKWTLGAQYGFFTSPSDAWTTIEELQFMATYDDSEWLGACSMKPTVVLAFETSDGTADGQDKGTYLQLGVTPGFNLGTREGGDALVRIDIPVTVGLSLSDYYQGSDGEDETFGYASIGIKASYAIPLDDKWGSWTVYGSATGVLLGDSTQDFNDDEDTVGILSAGVSLSF